MTQQIMMIDVADSVPDERSTSQECIVPLPAKIGVKGNRETEDQSEFVEMNSEHIE